MTTRTIPATEPFWFLSGPSMDPMPMGEDFESALLVLFRIADMADDHEEIDGVWVEVDEDRQTASFVYVGCGGALVASFLQAMPTEVQR